MKTTPTLGLKLYDGADAPDLVAGYNASMEAIDAASAEWGTSDIPENVVYANGSILQSPSGTNMTVVSVNTGGGRVVSLRGADDDNMSGLVLSNADSTVHEGRVVLTTGGTLIVQGEDDVYLSFASTNVKATELKAALAAIETLKTQVGELQTQIAAKANAADVYTKTAADGKFALKTDIPDVSGFITKTAADAAYQAKGSYATTATVTALITRVSTAEGEIDTLQTGLAAATAAGAAQLTVSDLAAAKTNTKNLVTA